jgi:hypothetical protein
MKYDGTATDVLDERPDCDFCREEGKQHPAAIDGRTHRGPWAYMCVYHWELHGVGLGVGKGQRLLIDPPRDS